MSWLEMPTWMKFPVVLAVVAAGGLIVWKVDLSLGIIVLSLAVILLILTGRDSSDRRGYKF